MSYDIRIDGDGRFGLDFRMAIFLTNYEGTIAQVAKPIALEFVEVKRNMCIVPTLTLPGAEGYDFMQALANCCDKANIKPPEPHRLEGEIAATKRHLEDLRMLLKLRKP